MSHDQLRADSLAKIMQSEHDSGMEPADFWRAITRLADNVAVLKAAADRAKIVVEPVPSVDTPANPLYSRDA